MRYGLFIQAIYSTHLEYIPERHSQTLPPGYVLYDDTLNNSTKKSVPCQRHCRYSLAAWAIQFKILNDLKCAFILTLFGWRIGYRIIRYCSDWSNLDIIYDSFIYNRQCHSMLNIASKTRNSFHPVWRSLFEWSFKLHAPCYTSCYNMIFCIYGTDYVIVALPCMFPFVHQHRTVS